MTANAEAAAPREPIWLYAGLTVVAVAVPLVLIRHLSLWYDELFSAYFAAQGPDYLLRQGWAQETNPPFYYLLLWAWSELFGRSEAALRAPSLLAEIGTLPVVYAIARRLEAAPAAAWRAVAVYACGAATVQYALMVRTYALWTLFVALAMLVLVCGIRALAAPEPDRDRRCLKYGAGFAAASVAALYAHDVTVVFAGAADATFLAAWWWQRGRSLRALGAWIAPQLVGLLIALPQLLVIANQVQASEIDWIPQASPLMAVGVLVELFGGPPYPGMLLRTIVAAVVLLLFLWGAVAAIRRRSPATALVLLIVVGFALLYAVSMWRPILLARTALWLLAPVAIVIALAMDGIRRNAARLAAALGVIVLLGANTILGTWFSLQEPWRDIVKVIAAGKQPDDLVVVMDATPITALLYYAPGAAGWTIRRWSLGQRSAASSAVRALEDRLMPMPGIGPREMVASLQQGRAVWLVSRLPSEIPMHDAFDQQALPGTEPTVRVRRGSIILSRMAQAGH